MHRIELTAMRSSKLRWEKLVADLPPTLESLGLAQDDKASDGEAVVIDQGEDGCTILLPKVALARRAARALAARSGVDVMLFEVVGSASTKRFRFRTTAFRATAAGALLAAEGTELDLEDPEETWGGGTLEVQANRVLDLFADLLRSGRTFNLGYRKKAKGRPSTPRVATLLSTLQKARAFEAVPQADGRVALQMELATGGKQMSFCTAAEHEELEQLLG
ncbi:MAG TPA: hypothetical protein VGK67_34870 [Myxococcales bacterium]|jgi:hypothetical protein